MFDDLALALSKGTSNEEPMETHMQSMEKIERFVKEWRGDMKKLYLIADRIEQVGKAIREEVKSVAGTEFSLLYGDEKKQSIYGNTLTLSELKQYEYVETPTMLELNNDLDEVAEQMKPFKAKEKAIKKAIKSEKDRQEATEEAKFLGTEYKIAVNRK